jgi:hypothetical protein
MKNYGEYRIFEGISGENLKTLTDCVTRGESVFNSGDVMFDEAHNPHICRMLLEGSAEAVAPCGKRFKISAGTVWGTGFFEDDRMPLITEIKALTECRTLEMDWNMMFEPCWFSCYFHALFIDNLERVKDAQYELIKQNNDENNSAKS